MSNLCPWDPPRALDTDLQNFWRGGRLEFSTSHQNFVWSPAIPCNAKKLFVDMCCFGSKIKLITKAGCLEFLISHFVCSLVGVFDMPNPYWYNIFQYRYSAKFPYRYRYFRECPYRYRYRYFQDWPYRYQYRYRYFSNCPYRYRYFQKFLIDIFIDIDMFKFFLSIFCRYWYSQKKCRYSIDISKNADISTIAIDIVS